MGISRVIIILRQNSVYQKGVKPEERMANLEICIHKPRKKEKLARTIYELAYTIIFQGETSGNWSRKHGVATWSHKESEIVRLAKELGLSSSSDRRWRWLLLEQLLAQRGPPFILLTCVELRCTFL